MYQTTSAPATLSPTPNLWPKVLTFSLVMFFVYLADAILSYWVPNFIQTSVTSSLLMGLIISFSSLFGLVTDLILPQIIQAISFKRLFTLGIITGLSFALILLFSTFVPHISVFLIAMAIWGLYYEFLGFANQQFVADSSPLKFRSAVWAIVITFKSLSYFLGPLIVGSFVIQNQRQPLYLALLFGAIGLVILTLSHRHHRHPLAITTNKVNLVREIGHWATLFTHVWPVVILSLFLGLIDATFWTTGTVLNQALGEQNFWGQFFLPFYTLPSLFMGLVIARMKIYQHKKKIAEILLLVACLLFIALGFVTHIFLILGIVFLASILLSLVYPLTDAVYSDIICRMGRERQHLIGLSNSSISIAYIIGPTLAGLITQLVGEQRTFSVIGILGVITVTFLLTTTPRKLLLPQTKIKHWE